MHTRQIGILVYFTILLTAVLIGCGKNGSSTQTDDIITTSSIVYSGGWGGNQVHIKLSSEIGTEKQNDFPSFQAFSPQITRAIDVWNKAIGSTVLILDSDETNYTGNTLPGCSGITNKLFYPLCQSINAIYQDRVSSSDVTLPISQWSSGWAHNTGKSADVIATTVWNYKGNILTQASIRLNRDQYVFGDSTKDTNVYQDGTSKTLVDLESLLIHELGHVLGLGHTPEESESVMYPSLNIGPDKTNINYDSKTETTKRSLSTCDIYRVTKVYSGNKSSNTNKCT